MQPPCLDSSLIFLQFFAASDSQQAFSILQFDIHFPDDQLKVSHTEARVINFRLHNTKLAIKVADLHTEPKDARS